MTPACMGGWCAVRARCERHTTDDREVVAERLCERGEEGNYRLISIKHVGAWEREAQPTMFRAAEPFDGIAA